MVCPFFQTCLDDQEAVMTGGIAGLIPLGFMIAHITMLEVPLEAVEGTIDIELIAPDKL